MLKLAQKHEDSYHCVPYVQKPRGKFEYVKWIHRWYFLKDSNCTSEEENYNV